MDNIHAMTKNPHKCRGPIEPDPWTWWYREKRGYTPTGALGDWKALTGKVAPPWLTPDRYEIVITDGRPPWQAAPEPPPTPRSERAQKKREARVLIPANAPLMSAKKWDKRRRRDFDALMRASREQQERQRASDDVRSLTNAIVATSRQVPMSELAKIDRELEKLRGRRK